MGGLKISDKKQKDKKQKKDNKKEKEMKESKSKKANQKKEKKANKKKSSDQENAKSKKGKLKLTSKQWKAANEASMTEAAKIIERIERDSIEQHRDHYDKDNIEQHRKQYEQDQQLHWYDQESVAMDLESIRRKPWYQDIKDDATMRERLTGCSPEEATQFEQWAKQNAIPDFHNPLNDEESTENDTESSNDSSKSSSESEESEEENEDEISDEETSYEIDENKMCLQNAISLRPKPEIINVEDEGVRLEYARRSVERLERIDELRRSRLQYKEKLEERRKRRKERKERAHREKAARTARENNYSLFNSISATETGHPNRPILVDLTEICDRTGTKYRANLPSEESRELRSLKVMRWKSTFKEEIPVIVDFTNESKPQQILDLTKLSEPPLRVSPPRDSRRLDNLRKEREVKLQKMTRGFKKVATKDKQQHALSTYHKLMDKVTREFKRGICV